MSDRRWSWLRATGIATGTAVVVGLGLGAWSVASSENEREARDDEPLRWELAEEQAVIELQQRYEVNLAGDPDRGGSDVELPVSASEPTRVTYTDLDGSEHVCDLSIAAGADDYTVTCDGAELDPVGSLAGVPLEREIAPAPSATPYYVQRVAVFTLGAVAVGIGAVLALAGLMARFDIYMGTFTGDPTHQVRDTLVTVGGFVVSIGALAGVSLGFDPEPPAPGTSVLRESDAQSHAVVDHYGPLGLEGFDANALLALPPETRAAAERSRWVGHPAGTVDGDDCTFDVRSGFIVALCLVDSGSEEARLVAAEHLTT